MCCHCRMVVVDKFGWRAPSPLLSKLAATTTTTTTPLPPNIAHSHNTLTHRSLTHHPVTYIHVAGSRRVRLRFFPFRFGCCRRWVGWSIRACFIITACEPNVNEKPRISHTHSYYTRAQTHTCIHCMFMWSITDEQITCA